MKKLVFLSAVPGVGKSTTCEYINNNHLLDNYIAFDIDDLENINEYSNVNLFHENAIKKAITKSDEKNIVIGSCINPTDLPNMNIDKDIDISLILMTCSNEELAKRLKERDKSRNCSDDEFIKKAIEYQNYMLEHEDMFQLHIDNSESNISDISNQIVDFIKENDKVNKI